MITSQRLWASQSTSLNDPAEITPGWDLIADMLQPHDGEDPRRAESRKILLSHVKHRGLARDEDRNKKDRRREAFVLSASTRPDDANQWRLYADAGSGYCIEIDTQQPLAVATQTANDETKTPPAAGERRGRLQEWRRRLFAPRQAARIFGQREVERTKPRVRIWGAELPDIAFTYPWMHAIYDQADLARLVDELVDNYGDTGTHIEEFSDSEHRDYLYDTLNGDAMDALRMLASLFKSEGFSGENEVRVVATMPALSRHLLYRVGRGIVTYVELIPGQQGIAARAPSDTDRLPIQSVRCGPAHDLYPGLEHVSTIKSFLGTRYSGQPTPKVTLSSVKVRP